MALNGAGLTDAPVHVFDHALQLVTRGTTAPEFFSAVTKEVARVVNGTTP